MDTLIGILATLDATVGLRPLLIAVVGAQIVVVHRVIRRLS